MDQTTNYQLKKPAGNENVRITDLNENADIIDTELKRLEDEKASSTNLATLENKVTSHLEQNRNQIAQIENLKADKTEINTLASGKADKDYVDVSLEKKRNVSKLIELEDLSDTVKQGITGGTTLNVLSEPAAFSVTREKIDKVIKSPNLYDKDKVSIDKKVDLSNGNLINGTNFFTSDYMEVLPSTEYASKSIRHIAYYDENKVFISSEDKTGYTTRTKQQFTTPSNAKFVRISFLNHAEDSYNEKIFVLNEHYSEFYIPYEYTIENFVADDKTLKNYPVLHNQSKTVNLFNKKTVNLGFDLSRSTGALADNTNRNTSDFTMVEQNTLYTLSRAINIVYYDENKVRIDALDATSSAGSVTFTTPPNCRYIRFSFYTSNVFLNQTQMLVKGDTLPRQYVPHGYYLDDLYVNPKNLYLAQRRGTPNLYNDLQGRIAVEDYYWSDTCWVGDEFWAFRESDANQAYDPVNFIGCIYIFDAEFNFKKRLLHNFGHVNSIEYNEEIDSLVFGNGSGDASLAGEFYVLQYVRFWSRDLADDTMLDLNGISGTGITKYVVNNTLGWKLNVVWGDSNYGHNNIIYAIGNNGQRVAKVLLGKGSNQLTNGAFTSGLSGANFNGTYKILKQWQPAPVDVVQGACYHNGHLYIGCGHSGIWILKYTLKDDGTWIFNEKHEIQSRADGTPYPYNATEGITIKNNYMYVSTFGSNGTKFIHKSPIF